MHISTNRLFSTFKREALLQGERVAMPLGMVLFEDGTHLQHVYFPTTSVVALLSIAEGNATCAVAIVGDNGVVGLSVLLGDRVTFGRAVVHGAGYGIRVHTENVRAALSEDAAAFSEMIRYGQTLTAQIAQTAACNQYHQIEQQLCRWLLLNLDRVTGQKLFMTHELIAEMLGVRRVGVSESAAKLRSAGVIAYSRGYIEILDRARLERNACACYARSVAGY